MWLKKKQPITNVVDEAFSQWLCIHLRGQLLQYTLCTKWYCNILLLLKKPIQSLETSLWMQTNNLLETGDIIENVAYHSLETSDIIENSVYSFALGCDIIDNTAYPYIRDKWLH